MRSPLTALGFVILMLTATPVAHAQDLLWAKQFRGASNLAGDDVAVDSSNNVYTVGRFKGTVDFDPGPATFNLTSALESDAFVSKLDSDGNFVYAKQLGVPSLGGELGVAVDSIDNVYVAGIFEGTVDFDPDPGTFNLTSALRDVFVCKLDSAGNFVWAGQLGGAVHETFYDVAVDGNDDVYTVGTFGGTTDFDPGPGTFNLISAGDPDAFVSKLDSAGNFIWAGQLSGPYHERAYGVAFGQNNSVYVVGRFQQTTDFDPGPGTFNLPVGNDDAFVLKLNSAGSFVWAKGLIGGQADAFRVAVDSNDDVYTVGGFIGTVDFDPGPSTFNLTSGL